MARETTTHATTLFGWPIQLPALEPRIIPLRALDTVNRSMVASYVLGHLLNYYTSGFD